MGAFEPGRSETGLGWVGTGLRKGKDCRRACLSLHGTSSGSWLSGWVRIPRCFTRTNSEDI